MREKYKNILVAVDGSAEDSDSSMCSDIWLPTNIATCFECQRRCATLWFQRMVYHLSWKI